MHINILIYSSIINIILITYIYVTYFDNASLLTSLLLFVLNNQNIVLLYIVSFGSVFKPTNGIFKNLKSLVRIKLVL